VADSTRREFVRGATQLIAGGALAGTVAPLLAACESRDPARDWTFRATVDVSPLAGDGQSLVTTTPGVDGARILVIRTGRDTYSALSTQCTHEGCPVNRPVNGVITCPCHGSRYSLDGSVLHGPALYPLTRYLTHYERSDGRLKVGSMERGVGG
jgi:Rieske Fe-S protein